MVRKRRTGGYTIVIVYSSSSNVHMRAGACGLIDVGCNTSTG